MDRLFHLENQVEKAQLLLNEAQAYPNPEFLQKAQQQLFFAQQLISEIDKEDLSHQQKQKIRHSKELVRHLLETKCSIDSL